MEGTEGAHPCDLIDFRTGWTVIELGLRVHLHLTSTRLSPPWLRQAGEEGEVIAVGGRSFDLAAGAPSPGRTQSARHALKTCHTAR